MPGPTSNTKAVQANRPLDYLYDSTHVVSSFKDHVKQIQKAQPPNVDFVPNYGNMFSTGRNFPAMDLVLRPPKDMGTVGMDRSEVHRPAHVGGADRAMFFRRPIVPYLPFTGTQVVYARRAPSRARSATNNPSQSFDRPSSPLKKTIAIQTVFRESEAQTDPYSPDYVLRDGPTTQPEILALATLSYGNGLPAGLAEIEMIERARAKREWESSLPPLTDQASMEKRLKLMEEMEMKEWAEREAEIKRLQEARLTILQKIVREREDQIENMNTQRMEKIWQRKLQEREAMKEKIEKKRAKILRKLAEKRKNPELTVQKRDIISEYANYASKLHAPAIRDGGIKNSEAAATIPPSSKLISEKELDLFTPNEANISIKVPIPLKEKQAKSPGARKQLAMMAELEAMNDILQQRKMTASDNVEDSKPFKFMQKIEKPIQRPPTPTVKAKLPLEEEKEFAALMLQRLIRGRLVQNEMYHGKQRRMELIHELRIRRALQKEGKTTLSGSSLNLHTATVDESPQVLRNDERVEKLYETTIQAEFVGQTLDFLSKELVRLREERRILAMVQLADRTRRMREAEETGRREIELERRRREDELLRRVMQVHEETVDSYLEDILLESVNQSASDQARQEVRLYADKINSVVDKVAQNKEDATSVAAELLSSFLLPEVERETLRQRVRQDQRKFLLAAHQAIYSALPEVERQTQK